MQLLKPSFKLTITSNRFWATLATITIFTRYSLCDLTFRITRYHKKLDIWYVLSNRSTPLYTFSTLYSQYIYKRYAQLFTLYSYNIIISHLFKIFCHKYSLCGLPYLFSLLTKNYHKKIVLWLTVLFIIIIVKILILISRLCREREFS